VTRADAAPEPGRVEVVDARGLRCPLPVIRLAARARELGPGAVVTVLATDPAAQHDVPAWARMRGHAMMDAVVDATADEDRSGREGEDVAGAVWRLTVRLGPDA